MQGQLDQRDNKVIQEKREIKEMLVMLVFLDLQDQGVKMDWMALRVSVERKDHLASQDHQDRTVDQDLWDPRVTLARPEIQGRQDRMEAREYEEISEIWVIAVILEPPDPQERMARRENAVRTESLEDLDHQDLRDRLEIEGSTVFRVLGERGDLRDPTDHRVAKVPPDVRARTVCQENQDQEVWPDHQDQSVTPVVSAPLDLTVHPDFQAGLENRDRTVTWACLDQLE